MIGISAAQAPGDESPNCVDPEGEFFAPPPENQRFLMDSRNYENLLGTFGAWDFRDVDRDEGQVRHHIIVTCIIQNNNHLPFLS